MLLVFTTATFLGAALLFAIQPFAARQALPVFGGSPAVWNTAVMFFQTVLLLGYIYAHLLTTRLSFRTQVVVHGVVLSGAVALPIGLGTGAALGDTPGVWALLGLLAVGVGLPFFAVSSAGPLVQRWFGATDHPSAHDPYFLYAASNAGSFVGLLAYPFLIEPALSVSEQAVGWRIGFAVFAALLLACGVRVWLAPRGACVAPEVVMPDHKPRERRWRQRLGWMFFAFVPSSLMIGVTQYLSTDIAAVPLLWIVPLGLYLLTFVAAFGRGGDRVAAVAQRVWPFAAVAVVLAFLLDARHPFEAIVVLHLLLLAAAGCLCHGRLRAGRPGVGRLTEFYLFLSIGGALAGVFHTFIAPAVFNDLHEYPLAIVLACFAMPGAASALSGWRRIVWFVPPVLLVGVWLGPRAFAMQPDGSRDPMLLLTAGVPALLLFLVSSRPRVFLATTAALLLGVIVRGDGSRVELRERTFFGVHTVRISHDGRFRELSHGTAIHGSESLDPAARGEPLAYYHRSGPAGHVFALLGGRFERVGFVGLGAGSMAAYGREGQEFDFFEIDPTVVRIAKDPAWFTFLDSSEAKVRVVVGDGRLTLAREPDGTYDCLVLDAFSSDSVPVHLLTQEAIELYAGKLRPGGVLLFHLSNRHLDLAPFAAAAAAGVGMTSIEWQDDRTAEQVAESGRQGSRWMLASADASMREPFARDVRWDRPRLAARPWTDARADIVAALWSDPHAVGSRPGGGR